MEEEFKDLFKKEQEPFNFGDEHKITKSGCHGRGPLLIGGGLAPEGLKEKCLVVRNSYDLEVLEQENNKILIFREKE
jgi:hypothetical protein